MGWVLEQFRIWFRLITVKPSIAVLFGCDKGDTVGSLTEEQSSVIIGSLLGDGAMRCKSNALLEINHCLEQKEYVDWKYKKLYNLVKTAPKSRNGNGKRVAYRFTTRSLPELTKFYCWFYQEGNKEIPGHLNLNPLTLAVWFMDDGSKSRKAIYLNTQQFSLKSQKRLIEKLAGVGLRCSLNRDKEYYRLWMSVGSIQRFKTMIGPHLLKMFSYKLPVWPRNDFTLFSWVRWMLLARTSLQKYRASIKRRLRPKRRMEI